MDVREARAILAEQLSVYRVRSYADLVTLIGQAEGIEVTGPSGQHYQIEFNVLWDDKQGEDIRVVAGIDDGNTPWAYSPLTDSFIMAPDGSFVDEE